MGKDVREDGCRLCKCLRVYAYDPRFTRKPIYYCSHHKKEVDPDGPPCSWWTEFLSIYGDVDERKLQEIEEFEELIV